MVTASGATAADGVAFRKKFKRAVVSGGTFRGARYSDLADADVRKAAKGYRGDPRFLQYCKQFVAFELVNGGATAAGSPLEEQKDAKEKDSHLGRWSFHCVNQWLVRLKESFKGRWFPVVIFLFLLLLIASRPAFGRLCGRLLGLSIKVAIRRTAGLIVTIVDCVLDEAAMQVEEILTGAPHDSSPTDDRPIHIVQQSYSLTHFLTNALCIFFGSLLQRTLNRDGHPVRPAA